MFHPSAANDTLQGRAIQRINNLWGSQHRVHRTGLGDDGKSICLPVCKKKYRPFEFHLKRNRNNGRVDIKVERLYGCRSHSSARKALIEKHGERKGWEPFGQWSLGKAKSAAKRAASSLNVENNGSLSSDTIGYDSSSSSDAMISCGRKDTERQQQSWQTLCHDGMCNWKVRGKLDDIISEIEEERLI